MPEKSVIARAVELQQCAADVGFDWPHITGVWEKLDEERDELQAEIVNGDLEGIRDELGDVFFTVIALARHLSVDPEQALQLATAKFEKRFALLMQQQKDRLGNMSLEELEMSWQAVKRFKTKSE